MLPVSAQLLYAASRGDTPMVRADGCNAALIRLLLQSGADANARNASGSVLTHLSRRNNETELLLSETGARYRADIADDVYHAIHVPHTARLKRLIEDRPDSIHRADAATDYTPLLEAA